MSLEVDVEHRQGRFGLQARFTAEGRLTALFGPSGSGKTTLVNIIGGLIEPMRGRIVVDGHVLVDTATGVFVRKHRRRIGYVFQEGRLFPHLTVRQNLLFGRWFSPHRERTGPELPAVVDLLGIASLLTRRPGALSGGEKQRVAIGRALLAHPRLLLMDEPLASLDEARKAEILPYLERLRDEVGVPIVYVSHAVAEVARLATTLVVLEAGRVTAVGPAGELMGRLDVASLSRSLEGGAVLEATVVRHDGAYGLTVLSTRAGELQVPRLNLAAGAGLRAHVKARDVMLSDGAPHGLSALNVLAGQVTDVAAARDEDGIGSSVEVRLDCGGEILLARVTRKSADALALSPGRPVHAIIKSVSFETGPRASLRGSA